MSFPPITFVYEPRSGIERYARFIEDLGRRARQSIPVVQGRLVDSLPAEGFIALVPRDHPELTLDDFEPARRAAVAARIVAVGVSRTRLLETVLEKLSLAAAIDSLSFVTWATSEPARPYTSGVFGRRDVGARIGATAASVYESERYGCLQCDRHAGLPHLLADYLAALARRSEDDRA